MRGLYYACTIFVCIAGTSASIVLNQKSAEVVEVGKSTQLSCEVSGYNINDHHLHWVRQEPDGKLVWIAAFRTGYTTYITESFKGRVTPSTSGSTGLLKIDRMTSSDMAKYYCAREGILGYWVFDIWGLGTGVAVTSVPLITPSVFPLIPYGQEGKSKITAGCLVLNYFPMPATANWSTMSGENVSGEQNVYFPLSGDPPTYSLVSDITVSSTDWQNNDYRCNVMHYSSSIQKTIPKGCNSPPLVVQLLQQSCPDSTYGEIELTCLASNLIAPEAMIKWFVNGKEVNLPQQLVQMGKATYHSLQSSVNISLSEWNRGYTVKCHVTDTKTGKSSSETTKKCSDSYNCLGIKIIPVHPTVEDLYLDSMAHIRCKAVNLKESTGYNFQWSSSEDISQATIQTEDPQLNEDGTYSVQSTISVRSEFWLQYKECVCIFTMPGLADSIITRIFKKRETNLMPPSLALHPPTTEEIAKKAMCSITCNVMDFNPAAIYITWKKNQREMSPDEYVNSHPKQISGDGSRRYYVSSVARIPCSEWEAGTAYDCIAAHEATPLTFTRKSIDKYSGKPPKINVSLNMCETNLSCS